MAMRKLTPSKPRAKSVKTMAKRAAKAYVRKRSK
jgi:hypothetical protein